MKTVLACLLLVAAAQAVDWAQVRPIYRMRQTLTPKPFNGRIIGGSEARVGQFPYQVGLFLDGSGFCGGSLISDTVVLTAGHCGRGTRSFEAHLGALYIYDETEVGRVIVTSTAGNVHQNYNPNNLHNDIALVTLPNAVSGPNIAPVRVPSRSQEGNDFEGQSARVSGWGRISDSNPNLSPVLKFVDLAIIPNADCEDVYGNNVIVASMICLSTNNGAEGSCNGDSGGPLVISESDGQPTQIGLVSFGAAAGCEAGFPVGYTRLTSFLEWLETNAGITIRP